MIGIFDSGCGGLTVLRAIRNEMPSADVVYFGDTKNAPYGSKSREALTQLTIAAIGRLQGAGATRIVSACNSVSASLAVSLCDTLLEPDSLIEMVGPTVRAFRGSRARPVVFATEATARSAIYQHAFTMIGKEVRVVPVPLLAGAIERGESLASCADMLGEECASLERSTFDSAILACTHFPLARAAFERVLPGVPLFDPAESVAERVKSRWWPQEVGDGTLTFLLSAESAPFRTFAAALFPHERYSVTVLPS